MTQKFTLDDQKTNNGQVLLENSYVSSPPVNLGINKPNNSKKKSSPRNQFFTSHDGNINLKAEKYRLEHAIVKMVGDNTKRNTENTPRKIRGYWNIIKSSQD